MLSDRDLGKALDDIFEFMESKGIFIDPEKKEEFKEKLIEDLSDTLTKDDIQDANVQKKIMSCITALVMGKPKEYAGMIETLKSEEMRKEPDLKLDTKLTAELMLLACLCNELGKNDFKPGPFKQTLVKQEKEKNKTPEDEEKTNLLEQQMDESLRNLWGGDNPTMAGEEHFPVFRVIGNLFGHTHQAAADPKSPAEMVEEISVNLDKTDPYGLENEAKIDALGEGIISAITEGIYLRSLLSPHPAGPGGQ